MKDLIRLYLLLFYIIFVPFFIVILGMALRWGVFTWLWIGFWLLPNVLYFLRKQQEAALRQLKSLQAYQPKPIDEATEEYIASIKKKEH